MSSSVFDIIKGIIKTEKSSRDTNDNNVFVFKVAKDANKEGVKKAVSKLFGVTVLSVNIANCKPCAVKFKGAVGRKSGYKKAFVKLPAGQKIGGDNVL